MSEQNERPIDCLLVLVLVPDFVPYYINYINAFQPTSKRLVTLFWNRGDKPYQGALKDYVEYHHACHQNMALRQLDFQAYGSYVCRYIREHHIKNVIFTTMSLVMAIPQSLLRQLNYILDYRDITHENHPIVLQRVRFTEEHSVFTYISSPGFAYIFKDQSKLVPTHNVTWDSFLSLSDEEVRSKAPKKPQQPYVVSFYGFLRDEAFCRHNIEIFAKDPRFQFRIYGTIYNGGRTPFVDKLIEELHATNVTYFGPYRPVELSQIAAESDAILYNYPPESNTNIKAMANKYYDGIRFARPLIGDSKTYSGNRLAERGLGITIGWNDAHSADKIADYLSQNHPHFLEDLVKEKDAIKNELLTDQEKLDEFIRGL